jgi:hypothetical protein
MEERHKPLPAPIQETLDLWDKNVRGMSKSLARSALFAVRDKRVTRERYDNVVIASLQNIEIRYSGEELRQDDHDVFMQLTHMAREFKLGEAVPITGLEALRGLEWGCSAEDYDRLRACYKRMLEGTVYVSMKNEKGSHEMYGSHLFQSVRANTQDVDSMAARWTIALNSDLAKILTGDEMTLISWVKRQKLSPLARWLQGFYSTHEKPLAYKAETLHSLCGSRQADMAAFRQKLKKAFEELVKQEIIADYSVGPKPSFLVNVVRCNSQPKG